MAVLLQTHRTRNRWRKKFEFAQHWEHLLRPRVLGSVGDEPTMFDPPAADTKHFNYQYGTSITMQLGVVSGIMLSSHSTVAPVPAVPGSAKGSVPSPDRDAAGRGGAGVGVGGPLPAAERPPAPASFGATEVLQFDVTAVAGTVSTVHEGDLDHAQTHVVINTPQL